MKFSPIKLKALVDGDSRLSKDIAEEGGFSAGSLSHWTLGKRVPGADELAALAKVFHVPLEYFFDEPAPKLRGRKPQRAHDPVPGRILEQALADANALLERAHSLKTALERLKPGLSSNKMAEQAGAEVVVIARDFANQLTRRSR